MRNDREPCPGCKQEGVSSWAFLFAGWPAHAKCSSCGVKLRVKSSPWMEMLTQLIGGVLLVSGLFAGLEENYLLGGSLIVLGLGSFVVPIFLGKLEIVR